MGYWRLFLASLVVAQHADGYEKVLSFNVGGIAVAAFFFISGFLMPLTYKAHYIKYGFFGGCLRFYLNRFLRIYPIYWFSLIIIISILLFHLRGGLLPVELTRPSTYFQNFFLLGLNQSEVWGGYYRLNNPAWTLDVELQYYLLVPLFLYIFAAYRLTSYLVAICVSILSLFLYFSPVGIVDFDRCFFSWAIFFIAGFFLFQLKQDNDRRVALIFGFVSIVFFEICSLWFLKYSTEVSMLLFFVFVSSLLLWRSLGSRVSTLDKIAGDLSYPVYILHFALYPVSNKILLFIGFLPSDSINVFYPSFFTNWAVSVLLSFFAIYAIGNPIEKIRTLIRDKH